MSQPGGRSPGSPVEQPRPAVATDEAGFVAALRALRTWSRLTYRQLEGKAAAHRDSLPASTIATALGRSTLPKERFVEAFTRACGLGDADVAEWLAAHRRIATTEPGDEPPPPAPLRWRRPAALAAAAVVGAAVALAVNAALPKKESSEPDDLTLPGLRIPAVGLWVRIHPAADEDLCVTDGRDRSGRYGSSVAAQLRCDDVPLPRVFVEPLGGGAVQFQWHHPEHGVGCLTVMLDGAGRDMLEPRNDCRDDDPAQRFLLDADGAHVRIRAAVTGQCLAPRDPAKGAEVVQQDCDDDPNQEFVIEPADAP